MPSRRQIREAVVQFLYCFDLEGGAKPEELRGTFWDFVTESERKSLLLATARTVRHFAHGREERLESLRARAIKADELLAGWPEAAKLRTGIERVMRLEDEWTASMAKVDRALREPEDSGAGDGLSFELDGLFRVDRALAEARNAFFLELEDFPKWKGPLEALCASVRRLQRISDRMRMVEDPERFPQQSDLAKIRESKLEIRELREQVDGILGELLPARVRIDEKLAATVENFSPERLDPVDRAILRLACHELMQAKVPKKVVINEAIELAKRYGTNDSSRFVNGVLDKIAATAS